MYATFGSIGVIAYTSCIENNFLTLVYRNQQKISPCECCQWNGLQIGWPQLDKRHLAKIMGPQGFYVRRSDIDPCPYVDVVW